MQKSKLIYDIEFEFSDKIQNILDLQIQMILTEEGLVKYDYVIEYIFYYLQKIRGNYSL